MLNTGKVLIAGGYGSAGYLTSAELYNPTLGTFAYTGDLAAADYYATATLLPSGMVLIAGGANASGAIKSAQLYNPLQPRRSPPREISKQLVFLQPQRSCPTA